MTDELAVNTTKNKILRIILWSALPVFLLAFIFAVNTDSVVLILICAFLLFTDIGGIYFYSKKFYNWYFYLFVAFAIGILFKRNHWPLAGFILAASTFIVVISSIINSIRFQLKFSHNQFLRWFGSLSSFVAALFLSGFLIRLQHWPRGIGDFLGYSGSLLFLISILALVFLLPYSNYVKWSGFDRKIFYRMIILPIVFLFVFMSIVYVFEDAFRMMLEADYSSTPWQQGDIKLFDLEGIPKIGF